MSGLLTPARAAGTLRGMKTVAAIVVLAALAGCETAPRLPQAIPATLSDGSPGLKVPCGGAAFDWDFCFAAAKQACPAGFTVDRRDESARGIVPFGKDGKFGHGVVVGRTLVFACK